MIAQLKKYPTSFKLRDYERAAIKALAATGDRDQGETIVQASRIGPELAAILKKLDISAPKPILAVG